MEQVQATINYFIREKLWCSIRRITDLEMKKGADPILVFWKAFGIFNEGSVTEAIRELSRIQERREVQFAASTALIYYHERCRHIDQETIDTLTITLDEKETMASDKDLITAATFLWHTQQFKRAGQVVQKVIDNNAGSLAAQAIKGWIYLSAPKEEHQQKSLQFFEAVLNEEEGGNHKFLEAMLGRAKVYEKQKKYDIALEILSEVSVCYKSFNPAFIEKSKIHIFNGDWDQALETIQKVMMEERQNVEALRIYIFYLLSRETDLDLVVDKMADLMEAMRQQEPKNAELYYNLSRLFARFCGRKQIVLQKTLSMLELAISLNPENSLFHSEVGYQKQMLGDFQGAYTTYQKATSLDESNMTPLYGMIYCRIKQEMLDDAEQQLEFLNEIGDSMGKTAEHVYLEAIIEWRKKQNRDQAIKLLDQALNLHISSTKSASGNLDFYIKLNADFLMELAQEYLVHCGSKPIPQSSQPPKYLIKAIKLLENVTKQNCGLTDAQLLLAKARWLANDTNAALRELYNCLQKDPTMVEAHVLAALINCESGNIKAAENALQQAFAQDFKIRENPVFMLMKSEVEMKSAQWQEAVKTLEQAYEIPGVKDSMMSQDPKSSGKKYSLPFGQEERARIFLNLVLSYCEVKNFDAAKRILSRAVGEFSGTPEEVRVMLAQSDLAMKMGDTKKALNMLKKIGPENRSFIQAKKKQAQLYLDELKDRNNYTRCYLEILDADASVTNYKMVAQALMDIQEPEEAIQYYEKALEMEGADDDHLVREVGKALVMTHDYKRAIKYYETTLMEDPKLLDLRTDLADLYIKLRAYEDAKRVLIDALKFLKDQKPDIDMKSKNVHYLLMMSKVFLEEDMQSPDWHFKENIDAKQALIEARALQTEVIELCRELSSDRLDQERQLAAEISFKLAKYMEERDGNLADAITAYNDCLSRKDDHKESIFSLARLYQNMGNNEQCTAYCNRLIKIDPSNENASYMLANLMLMKDKTEDAINIYMQLLDKKPDNFNALAQLIELLRRAGRIQDIAKFLDKAEKVAPRSAMAGLAFTKGLFNRYQGEPQSSLRELNIARFDSFFGEAAISNMIDIYLNPLSDMIYSSVEASEYQSSPENIKAAQDLIRELNNRGVDTSIIECNALIHSKNKQNLELAAKKLQDILTKSKEYVPALVSMALCKFLQKKQTDARNYLKTCLKNEYQLQFAEYFEKAWLLLADFYISNNKYDLAEAELQKCLKYNRSMSKAEEFMGYIKEKERIYVDAAQHYERAWQMSNKKNATVGFRLAFNYMKANRFIDAIDVGKDILKVYPEYPKVNSDIIVKARSMIKA